MTRRLAVQEQHLPGSSLEEQFEVAVRWGFDAVELRGRGDGAFAARRERLLAAAGHGVVMETVCVEMDHFVGAFDPEQRADALDQMRQQLTTAAEIGAALVMTPASYGMFSMRLPPFTPPRTAAEDDVVLVDGFGRLAEHAASCGVLIAIEPLNRYEDHMVNTLARAAALVDQVGSPWFKVAADTYHMNIEEAEPLGSLRAHRGYVAHVQLSDSNRLEPGAGHIDWAATLAAVDDLGVTLPLAYESRLSGPAADVLPRSTALLRSLG